MTSYAPPYAFLVIRVTFGVVASAYANKSFAPCLIIPPYSWAVPGIKPGTSTNVSMGILKASQNLTNLAAFLLESLSKQPAKTIGWFATTPIVCPSNLMKPIIMFFAKFSFISYGKFGFSGIKVSNAKEILFFGSSVFLFT